jgi:hypothetical protein
MGKIEKMDIASEARNIHFFLLHETPDDSPGTIFKPNRRAIIALPS